MMNRSIPVFFLASLIVAGCGRSEGELAGADPQANAPAPSGSPGAAESVERPEPYTYDADGAESPTPPAAEHPAPPIADAGVETSADAPAAEVRSGDGTSESANQSSAEEILRRAEQVYNSMQTMEADFVQLLTVPLLASTQRSEGKMFQKRPDRFLMRFSDPAGDVIVADGSHFWMYNPSADRTQVLRTRMTDGGAPMDLQREFISNPTRRYVATLAGSESVDGRDAHLISLVPRGSSPYRLIRVWVDKGDHTVRRFEMTEENESVRRIELRNLRRNIELDDSIFRFSPPSGTQVFDQ